MKQRLQPMAVAILLAIAAFYLQSCTSYHGLASKPDGHNHWRPDLSLHIIKHNNSNYARNHGNNAAPAAAVTPVPAGPVQLDPKTSNDITSTTASAGNEAPAIKNSKDLYKILTTQERQQARDAVNNILAKRPVLKELVNNRLNKLDEKYPAPAASSFTKADGGGGLTLGEILAIVAIACSVTFFLGIAGLVIGIVALLKIRNDGSRNWAKILAILAIVFGAIDILGLIIWIALLAVAIR